MTDFTSTFRRTTYPAISPYEPTRSQAGRNVLITGGSRGIGYNIARAFAQANASNIILVAQSESRLAQAVQEVKQEFPKQSVLVFQCDLSEANQIEKLWHQLDSRALQIDVLVLNAATFDRDTTLGTTIASVKFNMMSNILMLDKFQHQVPPRLGQISQKFLINITSAALHCYPFPSAATSASRAAFASYLGHLADFTPENEMRIVNLHPGCVFTERSYESSQLPRESVLWDDEMLSAHMAVWLLDKETGFLHGRFVWANWDVEELVSMRPLLLRDPGLLKVGVNGVESFSLSALMAKCEVTSSDEADRKSKL